MSAPLSLGIDIGGTFTDLVIHDPRDGRAVIWKESTTPDDPARGALEGTRRVLEKAGAKPEQVGRVVHATTLFTNALIERKGAKTGLLTTAGFRDVLEIGRERKYELYDLFIEMPKPLVPRPWRREAMERLAADGSVEKPLDVDAALAEVAELVEQGVESLAICFLHSYANAAHERAIGAAVAERYQNLSISLSSDVSPEIREYLRAVDDGGERLHPSAGRDLSRAARAGAARRGHSGRLFLMLSNGGLTHVSEAKRAPVQLLESGPAAGALAGAWFGRNAGLERVLAFDMGGTTAKLALVDDGEPLVAYGFEAAREKRFLRGSGLPMQIATVELIEIGAGGGSIAHRSDLGTLNVGPESSGAAARPGLLRPRRHRGHRDRCRSDPGLSQCRLLPRRRDEDRPRRDRQGLRRAGLGARGRAGPRGLRRARRGQREHGRRGARGHRRARPHSLGIRAAGHRRRGPRPCLARRAQARREARRLPAGRRRRQHHRHADGAGARRSRGELHRAAGRRRHQRPRRASSPPSKRNRSTCCA